LTRDLTLLIISRGSLSCLSMLTELDLNLASNAKMSAIIITERISYPLDYFNDVVDARLKFSLYSMLYLKKKNHSSPKAKEQFYSDNFVGL
jgi:hypothetical protein